MTVAEQTELVANLTEQRRLNGEALGKLGVYVLNGAQEEGTLRTNLAELNALIADVSKILGWHGPARELPAHARAVIAKLPPQ